jgi:hypothetical protein
MAPAEAPEPELDFGGRRPGGWSVLVGLVAGVLAFAVVAVVFSDQMAGQGDAADEIENADTSATPSPPATRDPTEGSGPMISIHMDATDPNVLVTSVPAGIDCGVEPSSGERVHPHCEARFDPGTEISLSVQIPPVVLELQGQAGWIGCGDIDNGSFSQPPPCTFAVDGDHTVCLYTGYNDCPVLPPPP